MSGDNPNSFFYVPMSTDYLIGYKKQDTKKDEGTY